MPVWALTSNDEPRLTLTAVANASIPPLPSKPAEPVFQSVVPGKQFSTTTELPVEHERAAGAACAVSELVDSAPAITARTT